jgi:hypothetical protein
VRLTASVEMVSATALRNMKFLLRLVYFAVQNSVVGARLVAIGCERPKQNNLILF